MFVLSLIVVLPWLIFSVPCTRLVLTSGAWCPRIFSTLFPHSKTRIPISPLAGHSLLVRNPHFDPRELQKEVCHAVFATDTLGFSPEYYARLGGELYLAGLNSTIIPLPDVATGTVSSEAAIEQLKTCARAMMVKLPGKELEVIRQGLVCFCTLESMCLLPNSRIVLPPSYVQWPSYHLTNSR
jgi:hypothetical protein